MKSRRTHCMVVLLVASCGLIAACDGSGGGSRAVSSSTLRTSDTEPNDTFPQLLGEIRPGLSYRVQGSGSFRDGASTDDEFDSYTLIATERQRIQVTITHGTGVDFDVSFVDPATGAFLTEFGDSPTSPETLTFDVAAARTLTLEIEALSGSGPYTLTIDSVAR